ncbi:uncharacterized protein LOC116843260 [Odontomachus brunneus]|uniref:uncharacterized protein LOC116843260 n=1 Tax=Odontomachus brunneus TaxID=486640 RepID=UPI0013F191AA|nr:uncharacterized protein LOC116843260 [Odontomachus brunneus]XP_032669426.1 uncharacterized protein LOC116843260 [Odontomachus brunneus]XP_032669427.1 uncharacterized protein LOC116843260 [Odontomachus brunneus]XP_032669428.1 uncharacterized protein LOC116843260 [Odontomachus brunneus]XP_032669429.1 uncharacterized protein LOC116843260 [Odontomachus brunneus]XP_032669430.1 uncharacterized protein LOC116843260 [Odontomachus brunneus]
MWNRKVFIRIIEVLLCVACVVALRVTDDESRRVFHYLRNRSREWSLLNNVTWGSIGAALATATCGGYIIITTGLLIAAATGELRGRKTEFFLLGLGVILFGIVGALSLASIDSVPDDLVDNAAVLGALCLITALVFIGDLLMSPPSKKDKQDEARIIEKDLGKRVVPIVTTEKDTKPKSKQTVVKLPDDEDGRLNDAFEKTDDRRFDRAKSQQSPSENRSPDSRDDRDSRVSRGDQDPREDAQNFENGRALRDSQRYREIKTRYDPDRKSEESRIMYRSQDVYQRPIDEIDTPRFPMEFEKRDSTFAKIINPSVKIMKVERDIEEALDNYRYSDNSQYDNVPVRMRGSSGILKSHRDAFFNVPAPPKEYRSYRGQERSKDEIEMLEECFGVLKTTGTQTARIPSSANEPGYVRHTASNWPQDAKSRASPDHSRI